MRLYSISDSDSLECFCLHTIEEDAGKMKICTSLKLKLFPPTTRQHRYECADLFLTNPSFSRLKTEFLAQLKPGKNKCIFLYKMAFDFYFLLSSKIRIGTEKRRYIFLKSASLLFLVTVHFFWYLILKFISMLQCSYSATASSGCPTCGSCFRPRWVRRAWSGRSG